MSRNEFIGWILFVLSACCFVFASYRSGDLVSLSGSLLFLVACFFFLAPLRELVSLLIARRKPEFIDR